MDALIWIGAAISLAGLTGILSCIVVVLRARRAGLPDVDLRARLQKVVAWNLAALFVSAIGLGLVGAGILLG